jgi:hypothetical protein
MPTASRAKLEWLYRDIPLMITGVCIFDLPIVVCIRADPQEGAVHVPPAAIYDKQDQLRSRC